jgi:cytochrome c553
VKQTLVFIVLVLLILGFLYAVSGKRVPPPLIPADSRHVEKSDAAVCMGCHGPGKEAPLKAKHPPKYECFKCHRAAQEGKAG